MAKLRILNIQEEPNVIDDHLLDIIGNEFKFDHVKGLAEWLKNAVDAYIRVGVSDANQYIILRFTDGATRGDQASIECIDFVGMTEEDIIKAFKRWGDPEAAKRKSKSRTYGGHGNGGKFYMRQMFTRSHFVTYREGKLSIFGFSEKKRYGFAVGYRNREMKPKEALSLAGVDVARMRIPLELKRKLLKADTGFTVVKGIGPINIGQKVRVKTVVEKFRSHPQSERILKRAAVSVIHNGNYSYDLLKPEEIPSLSGFEEPTVFSMPKALPYRYQGTQKEISLSNPKYLQGQLVLKTSGEALGRSGALGELNRIDIIGGLGVIASYQLYELGVRTFPQAAFIYGECECPILEDPENDCVRNDRAKLVENEMTRALLDWIAERIDELAGKISAKEQQEKNEQMKKFSMEFNEVLNRWKDKFMKRLFSEVLGQGIEREGFGGGTRTRGRLEAPDQGLEFVYVKAEIPVGQSCTLTLKTASPKLIPFGTLITVVSENLTIQLEYNKFVVKSENAKLTEEGESVGIVNIEVVGKNRGEKGMVRASAGKYVAEVEVEVVEAKSGSNKKPMHPKVLLSSYDQDPLGISPSGTVDLTIRDPLVFQRPQDLQHGIYWVNTSSPLAIEILKREPGGAESAQWRDFLFQRYVDIFIKEALYELQKKDPNNFRAEIIDNQVLGELVRKVHAAAAMDLGRFFFEAAHNIVDVATKS